MTPMPDVDRGLPSSNLGPPSDDRQVVKWLESQPAETQSSLAKERLEAYLASAAQPRQISGNACIKLCYFIEQCVKSKSSPIREAILSEKPCLDLFHFYIEWNEKNQNRSMRQVIELISTMIAKNSSEKVTRSIKSQIIERNISIITHQAALPLVKPAFKSLECLMSKGTIKAKDLLDSYSQLVIGNTKNESQDVTMESKTNGFAASSVEEPMWDTFFSVMFDWMTSQDISPAAGKFLVTVFRDLRTVSIYADIATSNTASWQRWIREGLGKNPEALENVKNYLFTPLFKLDKVGSVAFLEDLNKQSTHRDIDSQDTNAHSLLQLSAMETGKKAGLVEEPDTIEFQKPSKKLSSPVVLKEESIGSLLTHESDTVRSLAFSVLVSALSTVKPFSSTALKILQTHMHILYSDTDAKFRNEIMSSTKHMIERLRGATSFLVKEVESISFLLNRKKNLPDILQEGRQRLAAVKGLLQSHESFITWYTQFLLLELIPTASYQRHITALKAISLLLRSGILKQDSPILPRKDSGDNTLWPYTLNFFARGSLRLLMDLLLDPFEDVRSAATSTLKLASSDSFEQAPSHETSEATIQSDGAHIQRTNHTFPTLVVNAEEKYRSFHLLENFIGRAEELSKQTGRADHADGVARSYELLYGLQTSSKSRMDVLCKLVQDLETKVGIAEGSLGQAVFNAPIHGTFAALTFVWESVDHLKHFPELANYDSDKQLGFLQQRMVDCCSRIWIAVKGILCNDSPEGHLPQDLEEGNDIDTKDVLSYSFRAVHESSNLMRTLANKTKLRLPSPDASPLLPAELFHQIGQLSFDQLSNLRHRGAFSTVTLTFATCCQLAVHRSLPPSTSMLLLEWYQGALDCISTQVSTTRRSAGIPALVTGILSAQAKSPSLVEVMEELITLASAPVENLELDDTQLPQVHALNCLKDMVRYPNIRLQVESYVARLFWLALNSLQSKNYPIQNCGLILFRSLADSIFGTSPSKQDIEDGWDGKSVKISYDRYPSLPEMIVKLLKIGTGDTVLPALDFLRRAGPPSTMKSEIQELVSGFLGHKAWQIRETAAHTLCALTMSNSLVETIKGLFSDARQTTNGRHGTLLAVKVILERRLPMAGSHSPYFLSQIAPILYEQWTVDNKLYRSPIIGTVYFEVSNSIHLFCLRIPAQDANLAQLKQAARVLQGLGWRQNEGNSTLDVGEYASLSTAISRNNVCISALNDTPESLHWINDLSLGSSSDAVIGALRCIPEAFKLGNQDGLLECLVDIYRKVIRQSSSVEVQKAALESLCGLLEDRVKAPYTGVMGAITAALSLKPSVEMIISSPAISSMWTILSGWMTAFEIMRRRSARAEGIDEIINTTPELMSWSQVWIFLGKDNQDFDTRFAAAYAVSTFYTHLYHFCKYQGSGIPSADSLFPSMFALYNVLEDDDSDVRCLGAKAVSVMLGKSMVPQAATNALTEHMLTQHGKGFASYVVCRMTGTSIDQLGNGLGGVKLEAAATQLEAASQGDNKLFTEEKQNLWADEVQDATIWCDIFRRFPLETFGNNEANAFSNALVQNLLTWVADSVNLLKKSAQMDGAIGWTSKPEVFAVLFRTIKCTNTILDYLDDNVLAKEDDIHSNAEKSGTIPPEALAETIENLEKFTKIAVDSKLHPVLLQTLLERKSLDPKIIRATNITLVNELIPVKSPKSPSTSKQNKYTHSPLCLSRSAHTTAIMDNYVTIVIIFLILLLLTLVFVFLNKFMVLHFASYMANNQEAYVFAEARRAERASNRAANRSARRANTDEEAARPANTEAAQPANIEATQPTNVETTQPANVKATKLRPQIHVRDLGSTVSNVS
ncbi:uncharacterized protein L3040_006686 [Drepanopeziza brunnea f. sp. 'multigermtubi']|uniref:uncharacterized protein n=1 Tax=Drepanopeziza brunnea f. sp. 'multigermtubi' TaxID=698441 RepID=UPI00238B9BFE|nr:hypothetical protein L3040_006686 [Drepanopeziza brunnea f. sp. 'multigermtubi']